MAEPLADAMMQREMSKRKSMQAQRAELAGPTGEAPEYPATGGGFGKNLGASWAGMAGGMAGAVGGGPQTRGPDPMVPQGTEQADGSRAWSAPGYTGGSFTPDFETDPALSAASLASANEKALADPTGMGQKASFAQRRLDGAPPLLGAMGGGIRAPGMAGGMDPRRAEMRDRTSALDAMQASMGGGPPTAATVPSRPMEGRPMPPTAMGGPMRPSMGRGPGAPGPSGPIGDFLKGPDAGAPPPGMPGATGPGGPAPETPQDPTRMRDALMSRLLMQQGRRR